MGRESRLMLEVVVGPRDEERATQLVSGAASRLAPNCWPLWSSDGWKAYGAAKLSPLLRGYSLHPSEATPPAHTTAGRA
jgi:hypothetical protein